MPNLKSATSINSNNQVIDFEGCQLPSVSKLHVIPFENPSQSLWISLKRALAYPWNYHIKSWLKRIYRTFMRFMGGTSRQINVNTFKPLSQYKSGDMVKVRSLEEIKITLDPFNELKGCSFLASMHQYCGTEQRIFKSMERFLDERDYKLKRTRGLIILENIFCPGTPVFGPCDRSCFLFWREEWIEKLNNPHFETGD